MAEQIKDGSGQENYMKVNNDGSIITSFQYGAVDAFARQRVSTPYTIFDSKQIHDNQPLFWDESLETGAGITATYTKARASTTIASTLNTAGKFTRQTFMRFNYQPGKSQKILITGILDKSGGGTGVQRRIGYFDDDNGIFFEDDEGAIKLVVRSSVSGSAVDTKVPQEDWNIDKLDGTGTSKKTLDLTKTQIFVVDFEWLGVGRVRFGFVINGDIVYVHEVLNANENTSVYMSTPNLPLRYQMETTSSSPASEMECICSTVISEGGVSNLGILRHEDSGSISSMATGNKYAALGMRLKADHLSATVLQESLSLLAASVNDKAHWEIILNPAVSGTFTYSDIPNSSIQVAKGAGATVSGGTFLDGGYFETSLPVTATIPNSLRIGAKIDGTPDEMILIIKPITNNMSAEASMTWREVS